MAVLSPYNKAEFLTPSGVYTEWSVGANGRWLFRSSTGVLIAIYQRGSLGSAGQTRLTVWRSTDNGTTWSFVVQMDSDTGTAPYYIANAYMDSNNHVYVVWARQDRSTFATGHDIKFAKLTWDGTNSTWTKGTTVVVEASSASLTIWSAAIVKDADGDLFIAARRATNTSTNNIKSYYSTDDGVTWILSLDTMQTTDDGAAVQKMVLLSANASKVMLVWEDNLGNVFSRYRNNADGLTTWQAVVTSPGVSGNHSLTADSNNDFQLLNVPASTLLRIVTWTDSTTSWGTISTIYTSATAVLYGSITAKGADLFVAFSERIAPWTGGRVSEGNPSVVKYAKKVSGGAWQTPLLTTPAKALAGWDIVFVYQQSTGVYTNKTEAARNSTANDVVRPDGFTASAINDAVYLGIEELYDATDHHVYIGIYCGTGGTVGILNAEYWNGTSWTSFPSQSSSNGDYTGGMGHYALDGGSTGYPTDWATTTVSGKLAYYVRLRVTTAYSTLPKVSQFLTQPPVGDVATPPTIGGSDTTLPLVYTNDTYQQSGGRYFPTFTEVTTENQILNATAGLVDLQKIVWGEWSNTETFNITTSSEAINATAGQIILEKEVRNNTAGQIVNEALRRNATAGQIVLEALVRNTTAGYIEAEATRRNATAGQVTLESTTRATTAGQIILERNGYSQTAGQIIVEPVIRNATAGQIALEALRRGATAGQILLEAIGRSTTAGQIDLERAGFSTTSGRIDLETTGRGTTAGQIIAEALRRNATAGQIDLQYEVRNTTAGQLLLEAVAKSTTAGTIELQKETRGTTAGQIVLEKQNNYSNTAGQIIVEPIGRSTTAGRIDVEPVTKHASAGQIILEKPAVNTTAGSITLERGGTNATAGQLILEDLERNATAGQIIGEALRKSTTAGQIILEREGRNTTAGNLTLEALVRNTTAGQIVAEALRKNATAGQIVLEKPGVSTTAGQITLERGAVNATAGQIVAEALRRSTTAGQIVGEALRRNVTAGQIVLEKPAQSTTAGQITLEKPGRSTTAGQIDLFRNDTFSNTAGQIVLEGLAINPTAGAIFVEKLTRNATAGLLTLESFQGEHRVYSQSFNSGNIPPDWGVYGNSTYSFDGNDVTQSTSGSDDPAHIYYYKDFPYNREVQANITFDVVPTGDARLGIVIHGANTGEGRGLNLVYHGSGQLRFLDDLASWGTSTGMSPNAGETWVFKLRYENGTYYGKAWKLIDPEPGAWTITWVRTRNVDQHTAGITGSGGASDGRGTWDNFSISTIRDNITAGQIALETLQKSTTAGQIPLEGLNRNTTAGSIFLEKTGRATTAGLIDAIGEQKMTSAGQILTEGIRRSTSAGLIDIIRYNNTGIIPGGFITHGNEGNQITHGNEGDGISRTNAGEGGTSGNTPGLITRDIDKPTSV